MKTIRDLQSMVRENFHRTFGPTPLRQRIDDIAKEAREVERWTDIDNLKEEFGDLLASLLCGIDECGFQSDELLENNRLKIERRFEQYQSLGRKTKVALLGGAFNPVTTGHIAVAKFVLDTSKLFDEVWLVPCYKHMHGKSMESPEHRAEMVRLACECDPRLKVFDFEIKNKLAGETYHFVKRLLDDAISETHSFAMIIGMDNANHFHQWVNYEDLEKLIQFVIVPRPGEAIDITEHTPWFLNGRHIFLNDDKRIIPETSSTSVRASISDNGIWWTDKVSPKVKEYIIKHQLYQPEPDRGRP